MSLFQKRFYMYYEEVREVVYSTNRYSDADIFIHWIFRLAYYTCYPRMPSQNWGKRRRIQQKHMNPNLDEISRQQFFIWIIKPNGNTKRNGYYIFRKWRQIIAAFTQNVTE
jgi:hypothetical protein